MATDFPTSANAAGSNGSNPRITFRSHGWKILICGFAGAGLAALYTFSLKPAYRAEAVILLPAGGDTPISAAVQQLGIALPRQGSSIQMYKAILESRSAIKSVADAVGKTPRELKDYISLEEDIRANTISLAATDGDPKMAIKLVNLRIEAMKGITKRVILPSRNSQVNQLTARISKTNELLASAEDDLRLFNEKSTTSPTVVNGTTVVILPAQIKSSISSLKVDLRKATEERDYLRAHALRSAETTPGSAVPIPSTAKYQTQLSDLKYALADARNRFTETAPEIVSLKARIESVEGTMRREIRSYYDAVKGGQLDSEALVKAEAMVIGAQAQIDALEKLADNAPSDAMLLQRLTRKVASYTQEVAQLNQLLRQAQLDQLADPNRWELLDATYCDPYPHNKRYARYTGLGFVFGIILGLVYFAGLRRPNELSA